MSETTQLVSEFGRSLGAGLTAAHGGVPPSTIYFYIAYLTIMWSINVLMLMALRCLPFVNRRAPRHFAVANILLAAGDTAMFICFLLLVLLNRPMGLPAPPGTIALEVAGVLTTSLTMSCYYLFLAFYLRARFPAQSDRIVMALIYVLFAVRVALHYHPDNVWISMVLPPGTPNISAWLRNTPLIIYSLTAVLLVLRRAQAGPQTAVTRRPQRLIVFAMLSLVASFVFYLLDVFFAHVIPHSFIWIIYILKTIAYVAAAIFMYLGEFKGAAGKQAQSDRASVVAGA